MLRKCEALIPFIYACMVLYYTLHHTQDFSLKMLYAVLVSSMYTKYKVLKVKIINQNS